MTEVIKVKNLSKSYHDYQAVDHLALTVNRGNVFGLLGANGAGKSTSIECILGIKKSEEGEVSILGMDPRRDRIKLFQKVGVQFQEANYQTEIRVNELCEETACLYKEPADWRALLTQFGIKEKEKSAVKQLSGGERQRLFIVLALIPNPEVVFLDELTTGLDARARRHVWKLISGLKKQGLTILLTSHFMDEVEALCDTICILKKGKTVFYGTVAKAIETSPFDTFEDAYLWYSDEEEMVE
ncbi:MAG: ABC transporter ATP-binding protein [bacterium]|nr:ABC transporter ATP-binding protein [bacterium]